MRSTTAPVEKAKGQEQPLNQVPPLVGYNLLHADRALHEGITREGAAWAVERIGALGELLGTEEFQRLGYDANENPPVLHTHDRYGNRRDEVIFHPSWHRLMQTSVEHQLHSLPWVVEKKPENRPGAQVARAALMMLTSQNEAGHTCPISMTFSSLASLRNEPELAREWQPRILSSTYDPRFIPSHEKDGVLLGMAMTEKQGGSDVRANITRAERIGNSREYLITGHKWFCSAPMCDAFLVLAQAPKGLSCFLLPRWTPDGDKNRFYLQRLKNKLGNRSNASSEVEFGGAWAQLVGEEGRGVATIIEMVQLTRLDCAIAGAGLMRQALIQALHHARHRQAFGNLLIDQPLMRNVLADLAVESEAATLLMLRLARSFDQRETDTSERAFSRIATAIAKYWLCKRAPIHVGEALECLGGNGYVEESMMPRLYREAPLYSIWEGSGNVICLDILRALSRQPESAEALLQEFKTAAGDDPRLTRYLADLESDLRQLLKEDLKNLNNLKNGSERQARRLAERLAIALQACLIAKHGSSAVSDAFIASRVAGDHGQLFGTFAAAVDEGAILDPMVAALDSASR